jgi:ADP-ribose pyrophosphatase YjhB (NUDIX family)
MADLAPLADMRIAHLSYCRRCGSPMRHERLPGESHHREVCVSCRTVAYENPLSLVACLVHSEGRLLLARRAIEPARGRWFLPSGFVESRETLEEATVRELEEEACLQTHPSRLSLYCVASLPHMNEIYVIYRAAFEAMPLSAPGRETLETRFFGHDELPVEELAFRPFTEEFLQRFFEDEARGEFPVRSDIVQPGRRPFL